MADLTIKEILELAFKQALKIDKSSCPKIGLLDSRENNIASHLRAELEKILRNNKKFNTYQVDEEYDREGVDGDSKTYLDAGVKKDERPDILIHKRGTTHWEDLKANYAFIEVKKIENFKGKIEQIFEYKKRIELEKDLNKINDSIRNKKYMYGISLVIAKDSIFFKLNENEYVVLLNLIDAKNC